MKSHRPTVFLDRDGTLIREVGYLRDPQRVRLLSGVVDGLKALRKAGFPVVVVSNQSGVARGIVSAGQLEAVRRRFMSLLKRGGTRVDGYYWCPHRPDANCACRKPRAGLLRRASRELGVPWRHCVSVGDKPSDVRLGQGSGGAGVLVLTGYGRRSRSEWKGKKPDAVRVNFASVVSWILKHRKDLA